jgi:hypothetical protein
VGEAIPKDLALLCANILSIVTAAFDASSPSLCTTAIIAPMTLRPFSYTTLGIAIVKH